MGLATLKGTEAVEDRSIDPIHQSLLSLEKKRSFKLTSTGTQPILEGSLFNIFNSFFHFFCDFFFTIVFCGPVPEICSHLETCFSVMSFELRISQLARSFRYQNISKKPLW